MITSTIVATALLFALGPQQQPQPLDASPGHTVVGQDYTEPDGRRGRWASVEYELPTGEQAELAIAVTDAGASVTGEGWLTVSGEVVAEVSLAADGTVSTSSRSQVSGDATAAALAGLTPDVVEDLSVTLVPPELAFGCSDFGKKAVRAGKYLMMGVIGATAAACCGAGPAACGVCWAGSVPAVGMTDDLFEGYCD
jgi:hypothetical protein